MVVSQFAPLRLRSVAARIRRGRVRERVTRTEPRPESFCTIIQTFCTKILAESASRPKIGAKPPGTGAEHGICGWWVRPVILVVPRHENYVREALTEPVERPPNGLDSTQGDHVSPPGRARPRRRAPRERGLHRRQDRTQSAGQKGFECALISIARKADRCLRSRDRNSILPRSSSTQMVERVPRAPSSWRTSSNYFDAGRQPEMVISNASGLPQLLATRTMSPDCLTRGHQSGG
jgi:hypothetical protein